MVALPPSTPDNINVVPIVVKAPLAENVSYRYVWTTDSTQWTFVDEGSQWGQTVGSWATRPGETWSVEVTPFVGDWDNPIGEGPAAVGTTLITDAGRDSDNDGDGVTENQGDCDDTDVNIFPGVDRDSDGFPGCLSTFQASIDLDCNDLDSQINPGRDIDGDASRPLEDDDCDGLIDEDAVSVGDFVITEFMSESSQVGGEWVEVLHVESSLRRLDGWEIATELGVATIPSAEVDGAEFLVLCPNPTAAEAIGVPCANAGAFTNVLTGAQDMTLRIPETRDGTADLQLVRIDELPVDVGTSTQLDAGATASIVAAADPLLWCLSTVVFGDERGTPGAGNMDCPVP